MLPYFSEFFGERIAPTAAVGSRRAVKCLVIAVRAGIVSVQRKYLDVPDGTMAPSLGSSMFTVGGSSESKTALVRGLAVLLIMVSEYSISPLGNTV